MSYKMLTYRFAYSPTEICFSLSTRRNRPGFHLSASSPHTSGSLTFPLKNGSERASVGATHRLYEQNDMSICVPLHTGIAEIRSPDFVVIGNASGIVSSRVAILESCHTIGCNLMDSCRGS